MDEPTDDFFAVARERGNVALAGAALPSGLDQFAVYAGLIGSALDLGKLIATEKRDLEAIQSHHALRMAQITSAYQEVEAAMLADFERDEGLRTQTFAMIDKLMEAGEFAIAAEVHRRLIDGANRPALATVLEHRNGIASGSGSTLYLKPGR